MTATAVCQSKSKTPGEHLELETARKMIVPLDPHLNCGLALSCSLTHLLLLSFFPNRAVKLGLKQRLANHVFNFTHWRKCNVNIFNRVWTTCYCTRAWPVWRMDAHGRKLQTVVFFFFISLCVCVICRRFYLCDTGLAWGFFVLKGSFSPYVHG